METMGRRWFWGVAAAAGLAACSSERQQAQCLHPCDLAQGVLVEILGDEAAASFSVSDPCRSNQTCANATDCRTFSFYLGSVPSGQGAPITCHFTVTGNRGSVVRRAFTASYSDDPCCAGYEFPDRAVSITLTGADGGGG